MRIMVVSKYPPIQGGVSAEQYWFVQALSELGNDVVVLTNAEEVEESYKLNIAEKDKELLKGYRRRGSIKVVSTYVDKDMVYIPQGNPVASKLVGLGLEEIDRKRPDIIIASYLEPYGVAAMVLSMIAGIPYILRHAGSDIGRLLRCNQLTELYGVVLRRAKYVITTSRHHHLLETLGVLKNQFVRAPSFRLPGDIFYPTENTLLDGGLKLHSICKPGPAKGTKEILHALKILQREHMNVSLTTHWGGRHLSSHNHLFEELSISVYNEGYIPHWRVPESIRACNLGLFLENRFKISSHTPGIPLEYWACGRPVILTQEVAAKPHVKPHVIEGVNAFIVRSCPIKPIELAHLIKDARSSILQNSFLPTTVDASLMTIGKKYALKKFLEQIAA